MSRNLASCWIFWQPFPFEFESAPQGFKRVALVMAAGQDKIPGDKSTLVSLFQLTLMGCTDEGVPQQRQLASNTRVGVANSNPTFSVSDPKNNYYVMYPLDQRLLAKVGQTELAFRGCHQILEAIV